MRKLEINNCFNYCPSPQNRPCSPKHCAKEKLAVCLRFSKRETYIQNVTPIHDCKMEQWNCGSPVSLSPNVRMNPCLIWHMSYTHIRIGRYAEWYSCSVCTCVSREKLTAYGLYEGRKWERESWSRTWYVCCGHDNKEICLEYWPKGWQYCRLETYFMDTAAFTWANEGANCCKCAYLFSKLYENLANDEIIWQTFHHMCTSPNISDWPIRACIFTGRHPAFPLYTLSM